MLQSIVCAFRSIAGAATAEKLVDCNRNVTKFMVERPAARCGRPAYLMMVAVLIAQVLLDSVQAASSESCTVDLNLTCSHC